MRHVEHHDTRVTAQTEQTAQQHTAIVVNNSLVPVSHHEIWHNHNDNDIAILATNTQIFMVHAICEVDTTEGIRHSPRLAHDGFESSDR